MKRRGHLVLLASLAAACVPSIVAAPVVLWYRQPAEKWTDAMPIGNGRLGGMVFGRIQNERIQLNEDTIWNGKKRNRNNPEALKYLPEVRRLLFEAKPQEATALAEQKLMGIPNRQPPYQPLGDLLLSFTGHENATDYRRELNLATGIAKVEYRADGARFTREMFSSAPDQTIVVRISCDKAKRISFRATLTREQDSRTAAYAKDRLVLQGEAVAHTNAWIRPDQTPERSKAEHGQLEKTGVRFRAVLRAIPEGGKVSASGEGIVVTGANAVTLLVVAATDYRGKDPAAGCDQYLSRAAKPYLSLRSAHVADHEKFFGRVELELRGAEAAALEGLPTDERLARVRSGGDDPGLVAQFFQFGRYLLMGSSRPGTMAANLQGIWNESMAPPWDSKYTININIQMNYWVAEVCNLSEMHRPLFDLVRMALENGRQTAQQMYGARGFVIHHNLDGWGHTAPVDYAYCGIWPMGGAWLALHFWEHYLYGLDGGFLSREAYPVMKEAAQFLLDFLIEDEKGNLVTNPSHSPENSFRLPNGTTGHLTVGATMDYEIIHALFQGCIHASEILGVDVDFRRKLAAALERIPELKIGKHGQLQEWSEDYDEPQPAMGHVSHLFALYPGNQITLRGTPALAKAARVSLERREQAGGGRGGWPGAWFVSLWARLADGDRAYERVRGVLGRSAAPSLLNAGRVFQIDGNFGVTAGMAEMLLQSHAGEVTFLPAVPRAWPEGRFRGLRARGGLEIDVAWVGGRATSAALRASSAGEHRLRAPRGQQIASIRTGSRQIPCPVSDDGSCLLKVERNSAYAIEFR